MYLEVGISAPNKAGSENNGNGIISLKKLGIENLVLTIIQILIKIVTWAVKTSSIHFICIHRNNSISI